MDKVTSPGLKCRRTLVPIVIGKIPAGATTSQSSGKKVAEEEEEGVLEGPEVANSGSQHNSVPLGDLVCLSSPHETGGEAWQGRRSVEPLLLDLPQRPAPPTQTEAFSQTAAVTEGGSHVNQDLAKETQADNLTTAESPASARGSECEATQTDDVHNEEQEVQTEEAAGEDEGTQTIPIAMSQANSQTDPSPIQVETWNLSRFDSCLLRKSFLFKNCQ